MDRRRIGARVRALAEPYVGRVGIVVDVRSHGPRRVMVRWVEPFVRPEDYDNPHWAAVAPLAPSSPHGCDEPENFAPVSGIAP